MHSRLRLAQARGSLVAPNNSVQDLALELLDMLAMSDKERARLDMVKALVTNSWADRDEVKHQFPEYFEADPFAAAKNPETGEYDIDKISDADVEWGTASPEEDDEISRWIAQQQQGSFGADDFSDWH